MAKKNKFKKVTYNIPTDVVEMLDQEVKDGNKSEFVAKVLRNKVMELRVKKKTSTEAIDNFFNLAKKLPKFTRKEIIEAKEWGRA